MRNLVLLLTALAAAPAPAQDSQAAGFPNNVGGWTIVTNRDHYCGMRQMRDGYAFGAKGEFVRFCWILQGDSVVAQFENGAIQPWHVGVFEPIAHEPEVNNNQP